MTDGLKAGLNPQALLEAWLLLKTLLGVTSVRTAEDHASACATVDILLEEVGDNEDHPLADLLDYLANQIRAYEGEKFEIPEAEPREILRFLMDQHGLRQEDLAGCLPQSRVSEILNGKRSISKQIAKNLARRFNVHADVFL
jgi:HTH-type transcriptional regulator/antitoxin HigA